MKRLLLLVLLLLPFLSAFCQTQKDRPIVAVVMSGGGAKGVAHIGALKVIEEAGYPIDIICGTSMGALVGGLYSIGWTPTELDSIVRSQEWTVLLSDRIEPDQLNLHQREEQNTYALIRGLSSDKPLSGGLIRGRNLMELFKQLCSGYLDSLDFNLLPVRFACVATNIVDNTEVDFHGGSIVKAMRASMAIPGVFTPVRIDDKVLIDGGLRNNFPVDIAKEMGADIIIGINVQNAPRTADEVVGATDVFNQIVDINCKNKYEENLEMCDVVIRVDVTGYSAASFTKSAIDSLLTRGEMQARSQLEELIALRQNANIDSTVRPPYFTHPMVEQPEPIVISKALGAPVARVGFRFDSEEMAAVQISGSLPIHTKVPMQIDATARLGRRIEGNLSCIFVPGGFTSPSISYGFRRNELDIYSNGSRMYNILYRQHHAHAIPLNFNLHNFNIRAGLHWDFYDYYGRILTASAVVPTEIANLSDEHWFLYRFVAEQDNENHWYFPSSGQRTRIVGTYITDNLFGIGNQSGLLDISANWRANINFGGGFSLQPMLYGRIIFGGEIPVCYASVLGNEWFNHDVEQQVPFDGIKYIEYIDRNFVALRLQAQYNPTGNHYIQLRFTAANCHDELNDMVAMPNMYGSTLAYFFDSYFGPIGATIGINSLSKKPQFYLNIGHRF